MKNERTICNDVRDQESPARHYSSPDKSEIEFQAWLDQCNNQYERRGPEDGPLSTRKQQYEAALTVPNYRKSHLAYVQPAFHLTVRHIGSSLLNYGFTAHNLYLASKAIAQYLRPYTIVVCARKARRLHLGPSLSRGLCVAFTLMSLYLGVVVYAQTQRTDPNAELDALMYNEQTPTKKEPAKPSIINNSHAGLFIHFHDCRENEKHHVSCQFTDESGESHWVYLPGVALPTAHK